MTGMAAARLAVAFLLHLVLATGCAGRDFLVGGRGGWTAHPAEPFNRWAERNRFQVNDTLVFRYKDHEDSVLVVSQAHYDACNTTAPYLRLEGGDNGLVLANSGPYFFISGQHGRCHAGERLIVVVLAVRSPPSTPRESPKSPSSSPPPVPAPGNSTKSPPPAHAPPPAGNSSTSPPTAHAPPPARNSSTPPPSALAPPAAGNTSTSPPPQLTPPAAGTTSTSPPPALAPPAAANATVAPPPGSPSSASALRGSFLACLVVAGALLLA